MKKCQRPIANQRKPCYGCPGRALLKAAGVALVTLGLTLLFMCIPGWAWAAAAGVVLIAAGYLLLCLHY